MKKISVNILNTEECYMLNKRLTDVFETELKKDFAVTTVMPHLIQLDSDLSVILSKISQTNYTKPLAERDQARDRAFISLRDYCQAFVYDPDSIKSAAAKRLTELIHKIGWTLYEQGYTIGGARQRMTEEKDGASPASVQADLQDAIRDLENVLELLSPRK